MSCGVCDSPTHNVRTCPYDGTRIPVGRGIPISKICECCGRYGRKSKRHHTRGRSDDSDYLDVCDACHLECCHFGNFHNRGIKPRKCWIIDRPSWWRGI